MASVRCPGCGAKNQEQALKCRICGYDLRGHSELPISQPKAGSEAMKSGSLKGVFALAVLAVLGIVLVGVLLGILPGGDVLTDLRNKIPALATEEQRRLGGVRRGRRPVQRHHARRPHRVAGAVPVEHHRHHRPVGEHPRARHRPRHRPQRAVGLGAHAPPTRTSRPR